MVNSIDCEGKNNCYMGTNVLNKARWVVGWTAIFLIKSFLTIVLSLLPLKWIMATALLKMDVHINQSTTQMKQLKMKNPKALNLQIHDDSVYMAFARDQLLEGWDAYTKGLWDCEEMVEFISRGIRLGLYPSPLFIFNRILIYLRYHLMNPQGVDEAWETGRKHYDFGNAHFKKMFGPAMVYSCGYWKETQDLDVAQTAQLDLISRKLKLKPGMRVLDIGCGWGSLAKYLASKYGAIVVGVTVSEEGATYARLACEGLSVEIRVQDYRSLTDSGSFDRIVCVEMIEHVGPKNYGNFFRLAHRCLRDDGLFLLHVAVVDNSKTCQFCSWVHSACIPNVYVPHQRQIMSAIYDLFTIEDLQNIGPYFYHTAKGFKKNFVKNWPTMSHAFKDKDQNKIFRTWTLLWDMTMSIFGARGHQVWHLVLTKGGGKFEQAYESVR